MIEQFLVKSCPHAFAAGIIMASATCTVHTLDDAIFTDCFSDFGVIHITQFTMLFKSYFCVFRLSYINLVVNFVFYNVNIFFDSFQSIWLKVVQQLVMISLFS